MGILPYPKAFVKWENAKKASEAMASRLESLHDPNLGERAYRMSQCATRIEYTYCRECGSMHIRRANLCRDRLCPACAWRLSLQRIGEMMQTLDVLYADQPTVSAAMLTLTVKNVDIQELSACLDDMLSGWDRLTKRRQWKKWVQGYARSIEITRGRGGTFHPHVHALLVFAPGYDRQLTQRIFCDMWRDSCGLEYTPICDIRQAYADVQSKQNVPPHAAWDKIVTATIEASKYMMKPNDLSHIPTARLKIFADAIGGRRLISYGGVLRRIRGRLGLRDADTAHDVADTTIECPKCGATDTVILAYTWASETSNYLLSPAPYDL